MIARDRQFYEVLRAVVLSPEGESPTESALAAATGVGQSHVYLAAMIEEGWLEGAVEREPGGSVRAIFVRAASAAGRAALLERLAHSAGQEGVATLSRVAQRIAGEVLSVDPMELEHLRDFGLVMPGNPPMLTKLGEILLSEGAKEPRATSMTIIQGVTNSQVAVGSSRIKGDISIVEPPLERSYLIATVEELIRKVTELELRSEAEEEIQADLATIRSQLTSPRPKRNIIRACSENIQAVLQGAVGSAVYVGFVEILKRLMS